MIQQEEMLQIGISEQRQEIDKIYSLGMKVVVFLILFTELRSVSNFKSELSLVSVDKEGLFWSYLVVRLHHSRLLVIISVKYKIYFY